jgi:exocyst complex component 2
LARKLSSQEEDIKQLVRDNFDRFIQCKDVIDNLYSLITENEISAQGTGTVKLEATYGEIVQRANQVYGPLLRRQDETDKIKQALSILSRFSFLFGLPSKIALNIKSGDYDKAVQHYKKATALAEDSKVGLFRKVMGEVETIITEFRASLYNSLADPNASFESQVFPTVGGVLLHTMLFPSLVAAK